jgi:hypothetical protein
MKLRFGALLVCCLATAGTGAAQTIDPATPPMASSGMGIDAASHDSAQPEPTIDWEARYAEIKLWTREFTDWKTWRDHWLNRGEPGWVGVRSRRLKPPPPAWLPDVCKDGVVGGGSLSQACDLLVEWNEDAATALTRRQRASAVAQQEAVVKTQWWERIHVDALWPMPQSSAGMFGVVGLHVTMGVTRRLQVFAAPGVMMMKVQNSRGGHDWTPAADWGFSYHLLDFDVPGGAWRAGLHLNLAKAWVLSGPQGTIRSSVDLAGFSVTFGRAKRTH